MGKIKSYVEFINESLSEFDKQQIKMFIDKFDIDNVDDFKKETLEYMESSMMGPKENFIEYLGNVKNHLKNETGTKKE